tara:strand:+ start:1271 stop:2761 length:1491 start_codon:yes stop_codon:yes gene_type:complete
MATKNIVPNDDGEGQLGTSSKSWAQGHIDSITGTIATAAQGNITSLGTLTTLTVDDITIDGSTISDGGDITIDAAGGIILDADSSGTITIKDNTVTAAFLYHYSAVQSGDFGIFAGAADKDIYLQGSSGGSTINALHLDMSASGLATFSGNIKIPNDGTIGSAGTAGAITIASDGDTGFGTNSPTGKITSEASGNQLHLRASTATAGKYWNFDVTSANQLFIINNGGTGININDGGNIAIPRTFNDTTNAIIYIDSTINSGASTYQGSLLLQAGGAGSASYGSGLRLYGHAHASSPGSVEVGLSAVSGAKFTIDTYGAGGGTDLVTVERDNGNVTVSTGNLIIGTSGKGIDFSTTSDASGMSAEVLDDYEEGTWTNPQIQGGTTSGTISGGTILSYYTKIGDVVHAYARFNGVTVSNASGIIKITGLPYAEKTNTFPPTANFGINGLPKTSGATQYFYLQGSVLYGWEFNVGGSGSSWSIPTTATYYADISITYQV